MDYIEANISGDWQEALSDWIRRKYGATSRNEPGLTLIRALELLKHRSLPSDFVIANLASIAASKPRGAAEAACELLAIFSVYVDTARLSVVEMAHSTAALTRKRALMCISMESPREFISTLLSLGFSDGSRLVREKAVDAYVRINDSKFADLLLIAVGRERDAALRQLMTRELSIVESGFAICQLRNDEYSVTIVRNGLRRTGIVCVGKGIRPADEEIAKLFAEREFGA